MSEEGVVLEEFDFSSDQSALLRILVTDERVLMKARAVVSPDHFKKDAHKWILGKLYEHYDNYKSLPVPKTFINSLDRQRARANMSSEFYDDCVRELKRIKRKPKVDLDFIREELEYFVKRATLLKYISKAAKVLTVEDPTNEKVDKLLEEVDQLKMVAGGLRTYDSISFKGDFDTYIKSMEDGVTELSVKSLGTGIPAIDEHLAYGGLVGSEVGMVMAPYKRGKSMYLSNLAANAVRAGLNVVYGTLETHKEEILNRVICNMLGPQLRDMDPTRKNLSYSKLRSRFDKIRNKPGDIRIREYFSGITTMEEMAADIEYLRDTEGFVPDVWIMDYTDLAAFPPGVVSEYQAQGINYVKMRGYAKKYGVIGWTATQINRKGADKATPKGTDVADSLKKLMTVDLAIAIGITPEEKEAGKARIFVDASRRCKDGMEIEIRTGFEWGKFYMGMVTPDTDIETDFADKIRPVNQDGARTSVGWLSEEVMDMVHCNG